MWYGRWAWKLRRPQSCMYACMYLLLGRQDHLHNDGVAAGERGPQLPGLHHQREVPALSSSVTPAADRPTMLLSLPMCSGTRRHEESKRAKTFQHFRAFRLLPRVCRLADSVTGNIQPSPWDDLAHDADRLFQGVYVQLAIRWDCLACAEERRLLSSLYKVVPGCLEYDPGVVRRAMGSKALTIDLVGPASVVPQLFNRLHGHSNPSRLVRADVALPDL